MKRLTLAPLRAFIMWHFDWWMEALMSRKKRGPLHIEDRLTPGNDPGRTVVANVTLGRGDILARILYAVGSALVLFGLYGMVML